MIQKKFTSGVHHIVLLQRALLCTIRAAFYSEPAFAEIFPGLKSIDEEYESLQQLKQALQNQRT